MSTDLDLDEQQLIDCAIDAGAEDGKVINPESDVFTGKWVRLKCKYGCSGYGKRLTCPPHSPTSEQTREVLDEYERGLLIHFPSEEDELSEGMANLEREAFLSGYHKAFALAAGPCNFCSDCNLEQCKHPKKARPSMEACGVNVYKTVRQNGFPISVVKNPDQSQDYYGLLLLE